MLKSIRAKIDKEGKVKLLEPINIEVDKYAIVTILDDDIEWGNPLFNETAVLSEPSLTKYWSRPEEDEAWKNL
ncbi:MAG: hypothetical protein ABIY50_01430 [Ignavibacteria bacterium]